MVVNEKVVNGSTTSSVITRESGLRPLTTFTFKVRAYSGDDVSREWRTVSRFIGNQICRLAYHPFSFIKIFVCILWMALRRITI